jgi:hypothetical protein
MVRLSHDGRKSALALAVHTGGAAPPGGTGSLQLEAYVDGFLSGYNMASDSPDLLAATPNDKGVSLYIWIDNYCRDKPLSVLSQALMALKQALLARPR